MFFSEIHHLILLNQMQYLSHVRLWSLVILHLLFFLLSYLAVNICISVLITSGTLEIMLTTIIFIKIKQTKSYLYNIPVSMMKDYQIKIFFKNYLESLLLILASNKIYGFFVATFILINCPMNAYQISIVFSRSMSFINQILILFLAIEQLFILFVFHVVAAMYTTKFHNLIKRVIVLFVRNQFIQIQDRFLCSQYIERFHAKSRYGITYGKLELITTSSFLKVCLSKVGFAA